MAIPQTIIEEVKARTDLADLISSYGVDLRRMGADYKACCPFHHEKTPSFVVHPQQGYYHCFGCGEKGNVFSFVMKQEGLTFIEAVKKLANQCGVKIEEREDPDAGLRARLYALHAELAAFFRRCLKVAPEADTARRYLSARALPEDALEKFCVGYAPLSPEAMQKWAAKYKFSAEEMDAAGVLLKSKYAGGRPYNRFGGRLMFTICDRQGRPVAFSGRILSNDKKVAKYVNSPETLIFKKSNVLFGLDKAAPNIVKTPGRCAIVCEGQIDLIRCHSCGFGNTVASQGTAFTEEHARMVKKCADSVVLVFDADGAGQKAAIKTGGEFLALEVPVRVATLPPGEDPDSLLRDKGTEAFQSALDNAESITQFQVRTARAKEAHPESIDAVARVTRAALETIARCPSAVLRASLMTEAAKLLNLPVSALEEDFKKIRNGESGARNVKPTTVYTAPPPKLPVTGNKELGTGNKELGTGNKKLGTRNQELGTGNYEPIPDIPPEILMGADYGDVEFIGAGALTELEELVEPPPPCEMALCEFLFSHEHDAGLLDLVTQFAPDALFLHDFTSKFVTAWRTGMSQSGEDAFAKLRSELPAAECAWLDGILLGNERSSLSELEPVRILQDLLRRLWIAAVRRRQGQLPAASTPENDVLRLTLSTNARALQKTPWEKVTKLMQVALIDPDAKK